MDMKRVRYWDISLSEYRQRLMHDLSVNRTIVWKRTISEFFDALGSSPAVDLFSTYFSRSVTIKDISPFFFTQVAEAEYKNDLRYEMQDIRTKPVSDREVLVYVKQKETYVPKQGYESYNFLFKSGMEHEYLFVLEADKMSYKIRQVIPFYFIDKEDNLQAIDFPEELKIYDNIGNWTEEFELEEIVMGEFLARQITKRIQNAIAQDTTLGETYMIKDLSCLYVDSEKNSKEAEVSGQPQYFSLEFELAAQSFLSISLYPEREQAENDEVERIIVSHILKEFNTVIRGYKFKDYHYLELINTGSGRKLILPPHQLDLFNSNDLTIDAILSAAQ
jgi:hypothetical protein